MSTLKEYIPEKLLVSQEYLKNICIENDKITAARKQIEDSKGSFYVALGVVASCLLSLLQFASGWKWTWYTILMLLLTLGFIGWGIYQVIRYRSAKAAIDGQPTEPVHERIIDESMNRARYTAILIICDRKQSSPIEYATEKNGQRYILHCPLDSSKNPNEQDNAIKNYLKNFFGFTEDSILEIVLLNEQPFHSIKPIHNQIEENHFLFYHVKLSNKQKGVIVNHKEIKMMSLENMRNDPGLMAINYDVISQLSELQSDISTSFIDTTAKVHVIWNITNECGYNCAICATKDNHRTQLSPVEMIAATNHITRAKKSIAELDFAGGDPLINQSTITAIETAIQSLGDERVSVTTTGLGIKHYREHYNDEVLERVLKCEITIDGSHENLSNKKSKFTRGEQEYSTNNFTEADWLLLHMKSIMINIPLLDDDLCEEEIEELVKRIKKLKENNPSAEIEAQIIRLMPVGAMSKVSQSEYSSYNPTKLAIYLKDKIEAENVECRLHCSLRILNAVPQCDNCCSMLDRKICIDCAGNVFACTWGAYLPIPENKIEENPFFLGNVVKSRLDRILERKGYTSEYAKQHYDRIMRDLRNKTPKHYCQAVSWFMEKDVTINCDPLAK